VQLVLWTRTNSPPISVALAFSHRRLRLKPTPTAWALCTTVERSEAIRSTATGRPESPMSPEVESTTIS
jgi:hypothetical protein